MRHGNCSRFLKPLEDFVDRKAEAQQGKSGADPRHQRSVRRHQRARCRQIRPELRQLVRRFLLVVRHVGSLAKDIAARPSPSGWRCHDVCWLPVSKRRVNALFLAMISLWVLNKMRTRGADAPSGDQVSLFLALPASNGTKVQCRSPLTPACCSCYFVRPRRSAMRTSSASELAAIFSITRPR